MTDLHWKLKDLSANDLAVDRQRNADDQIIIIPRVGSNIQLLLLHISRNLLLSLVVVVVVVVPNVVVA
jgi:hypothetical protein